jgi:hypothetical protein
MIDSTTEILKRNDAGYDVGMSPRWPQVLQTKRCFSVSFRTQKANDYLQGGLVLAIRSQVFSQFLPDLAEHSS